MAERTDGAAAAAAALPDDTSEEFTSPSRLSEELGKIVDRDKGTPLPINDGAAPPAPESAMPSASNDELPYASAESDRGKLIPLQDASRPASRGDSRAPVPSTPPRASHDARDVSHPAPRTRTPPGTKAKPVAVFSPSLPAVARFPQIFPLAPPNKAIVPNSPSAGAVVQSAGGLLQPRTLSTCTVG